MVAGADTAIDSQLGWRFAIGVALAIGGYGALGLIPVLARAVLPVGLKTVLGALLAVTRSRFQLAVQSVGDMVPIDPRGTRGLKNFCRNLYERQSY